MNAKRVPQLFVSSGATKLNDPHTQLPERSANLREVYILKEKPNATIAVLYRNDDYGKDYLKGLKDGLGDKAASMIVAEDAYDIAETTIDSHVVKMKSLNTDVFVDITTAKFAAQAIRKAAEIGWMPLHFLNNVSTSIGAASGQPVSRRRWARADTGRPAVENLKVVHRSGTPITRVGWPLPWLVSHDFSPVQIAVPPTPRPKRTQAPRLAS